MTYLSRYLAGEHRQVWAELQALGPGVRRDPVLPDARAVAEETMRRVRRNLEVLGARLRELGYDFASYPDGAPRGFVTAPLGAPTAASARESEVLNAGIGPIPLSLEAFWSVVGSVDFIGRHPWWPEMSDPLVVGSPEGALAELENWREWADEDPDGAGPFLMAIAPDALHKDNVSGGEPYGIRLPDAAADALVRNAPGSDLFVDYLRRAILEWGGFPGLEHATEVRPELRALADGLEPF
jgi:hypothetical protein